MPDYNKGKIYKLVADGTDDIYIGSTTQKLYKRLAVHKCKATHGNIDCTSRFLFEQGNVKIILIEDYPSERKEQLIARERYWIETLPNINYIIPGRTPKENRAVKCVCDICGLEMSKYKLKRHQSRSLCQAVAEMRPTKKEQKECEKCGVKVIDINRHQKTKKCQEVSK